jgi:uncharacterized protein DUF4124
VNAEVFTWKDENGKIHFGDKLPNKPPETVEVIEGLPKDRVIDGGVRIQEYINKNKDEIVISSKFIDITNLIKVEDREADLHMTFYRFPNELFPKHHRINFILKDMNLWLASIYGLINYDYENEKWKLIDKRRGLPNDGVRSIFNYDNNKMVFVLAKRRAFTNYLDYNKTASYLFNPKTYEYNITDKSLYNYDRTINGTKLTINNSDIINRSISDVMKFKKRYWVSSRAVGGTNEKKVDGGVAKLKGFTRRGKKFTRKTGLAAKSSYYLANTDDRYVWVSHHYSHRSEDPGLSRYDSLSETWRPIRQCKDGSSLSGNRLIGHSSYLVIEQRNRLLIYNTNTQECVSLDKKIGIPGNTIDDMKKDDDSIWITSHTYPYRGRRSGKPPENQFQGESGITRIKLSSLPNFFE